MMEHASARAAHIEDNVTSTMKMHCVKNDESSCHMSVAAVHEI